jgi:hypothetical protein
MNTNKIKKDGTAMPGEGVFDDDQVLQREEGMYDIYASPTDEA